MAGTAFEANSRSIIATLWNANDRSTADLMYHFYNLLKQEAQNSKIINKAKVLRLAQLELLKDERYQHPHYWSPFILVGNWLLKT